MGRTRGGRHQGKEERSVEEAGAQAVSEGEGAKAARRRRLGCGRHPHRGDRPV